jgi:hypothetical protein
MSFFRSVAELVLLCGVGSSLSAPARAQGHGDAWHAPASPSEQALNRTLKRIDADDNALDNILGGRGQKTYRRTVDYGPMLTPRLIAAIAAFEKSKVRADCGGRYRDGEVCGLDYNPVTCAQDSNDSYVYRTDQQTPTTARIAYAWAADAKEPSATYRMVLDGGAWKIDAVGCQGGDSFNMR